MNHYELHAYYFNQTAELDVPILQYPKLDIEIGMILEIKIKLGELQQIDVETFEFALKEIISLQESLMRGTEIKLETEKAILKCRVCGQEWAFGDAMKELSEEESESLHFVPEIAHVYVRCPKCKSPDFEVIRGRGVSFLSL